MDSSGKSPDRIGKVLPAGTVVFSEGDQGREMYVIQTGKVKIAKHVRDMERVLAVLGDGEFFGEMAIINQKPRSATATAVEETKLLVIEPETFDDMVRGNSEIAIRLIKILASRLQLADEHIENLMLADPFSRVVRFLDCHARRGTKVPEGIGILLPLVSEEIAPEVALEIAQVEEALEKLCRAQLLLTTVSGIVVFDQVKLHEYLSLLEMKEKFRDP